MMRLKDRPRMKRLAISFFYDNDGILDDYMVVFLTAMREHVSRLVFVVNGKFTPESRAKVENIVDEIIIRDNSGFDVYAYKAGLEHVGFDNLGQFDEVLLFNHTFFAPIFPFSEMFGSMEERSCDFWGITAHREVAAVHGHGGIAYHLNSHFFAVRKAMAVSDAFAAYWRDMPAINSYEDSISIHETRFTAHFRACGFQDDVYIDPEKFGADYAAFFLIDEMVTARCPILKRRPFFHDPMFLEEQAIDLPRALRLVEEKSDYDIGLVWQNIMRTTPLRIASTNSSLMKIVPDQRVKPARAPKKYGRIAVCVHAYYDDLIDEVLDYTAHIPVPYDFIVTTDTLEKKARIEERARLRKGIGKIIVRVPEQWRGRDMGALLIGCQDLLANSDYDLLLRLHTKKSPQVAATQGNMFKRHMLENLVNSPGFVTNILDMFADQPHLGVVMPAMFHISYPTIGHAWFVNKERAKAAAEVCHIRVPFDGLPPVAPYGGMYWARPKAIRKLFAGWNYQDFEGEPHPPDGGLAHALERIVAYAAQDAGYLVETVLSPHQAAHNYTMLEYKLHLLGGQIPTGDLRHQNAIIGSWRGLHDMQRHGLAQVVSKNGLPPIEQIIPKTSVRAALSDLEVAIKHSVAHRYPWIRRLLSPMYRRLRGFQQTNGQ